MFWSLGRRNRFEEPGEAARRVHGQWLTRVLRSGRAVPRIPTRPVSEGGFAPIIATPDGKRWAEHWWSDTLETTDLEP